MFTMYRELSNGPAENNETDLACLSEPVLSQQNEGVAS